MQSIPCPFCGPRDEVEFRCGGQTHITRPEPEKATDEEWAVYLYVRDNPRGWARERWLHAYGCRQWFNLVRNTVTHQIQQTYAMTAPRPALPQEAQP